MEVSICSDKDALAWPACVRLYNCILLNKFYSLCHTMFVKLLDKINKWLCCCSLMWFCSDSFVVFMVLLMMSLFLLFRNLAILMNLIIASRFLLVCAYIWPLLCLLTDCFRRTQTQSIWDITGWPSGWWGACLQKDQIESWRCSREECSDKFLGMRN